MSNKSENNSSDMSESGDLRDPLKRVGVVDAGDQGSARYTSIAEDHLELFDITTRTTRRGSSRAS